MADRIEKAAAFLASLRLRENGIRPPVADIPAAIRPRSIAGAYEVQHALRDRLAASRPGPPAGWKIGCTTKVMQDYLDIDHPCAGTLFEAQFHTGAARLRHADYRHLGLECEIGVRLARDLAPGGDPGLAAGQVMTSVEIIEHRFEDFARTAKESLIADDFFSAGCVAGPAIAIKDAGDLATLQGGFHINGAEPELTGRGSAILGHPLNALAWLAEHLAPQGGLKAGVFVTLGSVIKTIYPAPGTRITAQFDRLGPVAIEII